MNFFWLIYGTYINYVSISQVHFKLLYHALRLAARTEASNLYSYIHRVCKSEWKTRHKGILKFTTYRAPSRQPPTVRRRRRRGWARRAARVRPRGPSRLQPPRHAAATLAALYSRTLSPDRQSARVNTISSTTRDSLPACPCLCTVPLTQTPQRLQLPVWRLTSLL